MSLLDYIKKAILNLFSQREVIKAQTEKIKQLTEQNSALLIQHATDGVEKEDAINRAKQAEIARANDAAELDALHAETDELAAAISVDENIPIEVAPDGTITSPGSVTFDLADKPEPDPVVETPAEPPVATEPPVEAQPETPADPNFAEATFSGENPK